MDLLTRARAADREDGEQKHVALDGKTLRGTQGHLAADQEKMHQVSLYETHTGIVLKEHIVGDKENELSRIEEFLAPQCITGRIVTADSLHTQKAFCLGVTLAQGAYVLCAKGNQVTLHEDLRLFFTDPPANCRNWRSAETFDKGHERLHHHAEVLAINGRSYRMKERQAALSVPSEATLTLIGATSTGVQ